MFMIRVKTKSVRPQAKIDSKPIDPAGRSPSAVEPMNVVIVANLGGIDPEVRLQAGREQHDHRLADAAGDLEHDRGDDARDRRGEDHTGRDQGRVAPMP